MIALPPNRGETAGGTRPARPVAIWRALTAGCQRSPTIRATLSALGEGCTPSLLYTHPLADQAGFRLEVKDEGVPRPGFGANPTLSFKDRGMAMTVSMAPGLGDQETRRSDTGKRRRCPGGIRGRGRNRGRDRHVARHRLARPGQGCRLPGDSIRNSSIWSSWPARSSTAAGGSASITSRMGFFNVATFQEPGWRTEGKKTLGLEMAEPTGPGLEPRVWRLPDVIVYPTGGGTGVVGMAKAFDELRGSGAGRAGPSSHDLRPVGRDQPDRPRV